MPNSRQGTFCTFHHVIVSALRGLLAACVGDLLSQMGFGDSGFRCYLQGLGNFARRLATRTIEIALRVRRVIARGQKVIASISKVGGLAPLMLQVLFGSGGLSVYLLSPLARH